MNDGYFETWRGDVKPWECDVVEHFTVAYYYEKFEAANWRLLGELGANPASCRVVDAYTRYQSELRAGDLFHIESALISGGDNPVVAHKVFNTGTGEVCTTTEFTIEGATLTGPVAEWDGDAREDRGPAPAGVTFMAAGRDVVKPGDLDLTGKLGLAGYIHLFSGSAFHLFNAIGLTPSYLRENRIGYSTFEFKLDFHGGALPGTPINVDSCVAQIGSSSLRLMHRLSNAANGELLAELGQFGVHLDLDARRPSRVPDDIRTKVQTMLDGGTA